MVSLLGDMVFLDLRISEGKPKIKVTIGEEIGDPNLIYRFKSMRLTEATPTFDEPSFALCLTR